MKALGLTIVIILILLAVFAVANWGVLSQTVPLTFIAFEIRGPLGVILLGVALGLTALVAAYALVLRTTWLVESRRLSKEVQKQRELAEQAETSRLTDLRRQIELELTGLRTAIQQSGAMSVARLEKAEQALAETITESVNAMTAQLGYLDDKLDRVSGRKPDTES